MYENTEKSVLSRNIARNIYTEACNKPKITLSVVFCHPWGSKPTVKSKDFEGICTGLTVNNCKYCEPHKFAIPRDSNYKWSHTLCGLAPCAVRKLRKRQAKVQKTPPIPPPPVNPTSIYSLCPLLYLCF